MPFTKGNDTMKKYLFLPLFFITIVTYGQSIFDLPIKTNYKSTFDSSIDPVKGALLINNIIENAEITHLIMYDNEKKVLAFTTNDNFYPLMFKTNNSVPYSLNQMYCERSDRTNSVVLRCHSSFSAYMANILTGGRGKPLDLKIEIFDKIIYHNDISYAIEKSSPLK